MLKNAPMFKKQGTKTGTAGRGKSAILRAQAARGRGRGAGSGPPGQKPGQGGKSGQPWQGGKKNLVLPHLKIYLISSNFVNFRTDWRARTRWIINVFNHSTSLS